MAEITISTDGTIQNTKLIVDGKEVTKKEKVISMSLYAYSSYTSKYSGEKLPGSVGVDYEFAKDDGTVERRSVFSSSVKYTNGIGEKIKDSTSVSHFVGQEADKETSLLVDAIEKHCVENKLKCPSRDILLARSIDSLTNKAVDLGINVDELKKTEEITPPVAA